MEDSDISPAWRLADPLTVRQAAALIAGHDPNRVRYREGEPAYFETPDGHTYTEGIEDVRAIFNALTNAVVDGNLPATIRRAARARGWNEEPAEGERLAKNVALHPAGQASAVNPPDIGRQGIIYRVAPDWSKTTVTVKALNAWLHKAGHPPLFAPTEAEGGPWPWGTYTTRRLELVAEVVREFWSTYDPDQPKTAPTNAEIRAWLIEEKGVSEREATAIAMVCRADDAPTTKR